METTDDSYTFTNFDEVAETYKKIIQEDPSCQELLTFDVNNLLENEENYLLENGQQRLLLTYNKENNMENDKQIVLLQNDKQIVLVEDNKTVENDKRFVLVEDKKTVVVTTQDNELKSVGVTYSRRLAQPQRELVNPSSVRLFRWTPTSPLHIENSEKVLLQALLGTKYRHEVVDLGDGIHINTIQTGKKTNPPLVMLHGFAGSLGLWCCNLRQLREHYYVHAIDWIGFGRSSKNIFTGNSVADALDFFLVPLERWRKAMNLEKFIGLGHSMGGYLLAHYALRYPHRLTKMILADAWGIVKVPDMVNDGWAGRKLPLYLQLARRLVQATGSPMEALKWVGPFGPSMVAKIRPGLINMYAKGIPAEIVQDYLYHCLTNTELKSSEKAFSMLYVNVEGSFLPWAKEPLCETLTDEAVATLKKHNILTLFIYGSSSWVYHRGPETLRRLERKMNAPLVLVNNAGHHVYAEESEVFNNLVILLKDVDDEKQLWEIFGQE